MKEKTIKVRVLECPHCAYAWFPRVEQPKECPRCKRSLRPKNNLDTSQK